MEERTNNAIEKVENIINAKKHPKSMRVKNREDTAEERKAKQERYMAEKRVELARLRAHKKAEKQKAKAMAERERNRRKAEIKQRKQEEKQARERRKAERRNERAQARQRGKDGNKGFGGWLAAVITLSVATLVLASVLTFTFLMPTASDGMLESTYQKSFYDTVKQVDNIDVNLSKILATSDTGAIQKYLVETAINSEIAETDLQQLPLHDESRYYTTKLINQIGDYAKYLNNKLVDGEKLNKEDEQILKGLYQANRTLKNALAEMTNGMGNDFSFRTVLDGGDGNLIINGFNELENMSVDYPELIYDGPFSDGQDEREIKGVKGEEITSEQAVEEYKKIFKNYGLEKVMANGMTSSEIECYNVQGEKDGETLYAEISKKGGRLIMFTSAGSCRATNVTEESAEQTAKEFLKGIGITNVKAVWINLTGNVYTINFAVEQDGVIIYSDLVKVRVCAETETVIGIEAKSYYTNHTERKIATPKLSQSQASEKVSKNIGVITCRLALVPVGKNSEKLCYEFSGEYQGATYYVYIDALNGKQVEMFKVIEGTEGSLLI